MNGTLPWSETTTKVFRRAANCAVLPVFFRWAALTKSGTGIPMIVRLKNVKLLNTNQKPLAVQLPSMRFELGDSEDDLPTAIEENTLPSLQFSPNPTRDWLQIAPPRGFSKALKARLFDKNGAVVLESESLELDVRELQEGLHWLQLEDLESGEVTKGVKVVIL